MAGTNPGKPCAKGEWRPERRLWPAVSLNGASRRLLCGGLLAFFAAATVCNDLSILQRAGSRVDALREAFASFPISGEPEPPDDVVHQWREACKAAAVTAGDLGAEPPRPELLSHLESQLAILHNLREPLEQFLARDSAEDLQGTSDDSYTQALALLQSSRRNSSSRWMFGMPPRNA